MEEGVFEDGQEGREEVVSEDAREDIQGRCRALPQVPVRKGAVVVAAAFIVACVALIIKAC